MANLTLKEYKGIEVVLEAVELTESAVSSYVSDKLAELAQNATQFVMVDRAATEGDLVNLEYEGFIDGMQFDGGTADNCDLILGSGRFIPGFEEQLLGCKAGEVVYVRIRFPEPYFYEELSGKEAVFSCKIHAVYEPNTPEINDEYAVKSGYESLEAMVMKYAEEAKQMHLDQMDEALELEAMEILVDLVEGEVDAAQVESQLDKMIADFADGLANAGMELASYLEETGTTEVALRDSYRANAIKSVKLDAALMLIKDAENITVSPAEMEAEYHRLMEAYSLTMDDMHEYLPEEILVDNMTRAKCMEVVKQNAKITWK